MEKVTLNNKNIEAKLHYLAMYCYKQVATYNKHPAPDVSYKRLKDKMAMSTPTVDRTNTVDYTKRYPTLELAETVSAFLGAMKINTNTKNWYVSEIGVQPKKWGWTAWNNSHLKKRKFIRFIYNRSTGVTHWVGDGQIKKIPDQHNPTNWTVLAGSMEGSQWLADRNTGLNTPRFVFEISIPAKNLKEWEKAKELIRNV
tara:strand:- start:115 stop:711 length:597 start_codon:yes stop_codon:yes gene_type:complete